MKKIVYNSLICIFWFFEKKTTTTKQIIINKQTNKQHYGIDSEHQHAPSILHFDVEYERHSAAVPMPIVESLGTFSFITCK